MTFTLSLVRLVAFFLWFLGCSDSNPVSDFDNKNKINAPVVEEVPFMKHDPVNHVNNTKDNHEDLSGSKSINNTDVQELSIQSVTTTKVNHIKDLNIDNMTDDNFAENKEIKDKKTKKIAEIVTKRPDDEDCLLLKWLFICRDFQMVKDKDIFKHPQ